MSVTDAQLFEAAKRAQANAYAPYSKFNVGAAILDADGTVHIGCNVENAAYPQGACAEASAIGAMATAGGRRIATIAVVGGKSGQFCAPCGGCRQRIAEFSDRNTRILIEDGPGNIKVFSVADLLPHSFGPADLPSKPDAPKPKI